MTAVRRQFAHVAASVPAARCFAGVVLQEAARGVRETVQLLVSELATNALLYSAAPFEVSIDPEWAPAVIRISVTDSSEGRPRAGRPSKYDEHGRLARKTETNIVRGVGSSNGWAPLALN